MRKKIVTLIVLSIIILISFGIYHNQKQLLKTVYEPVKKVYNIGEKVEFGDDDNEGIKSEGYAVKVLKSYGIVDEKKIIEILKEENVDLKDDKEDRIDKDNSEFWFLKAAFYNDGKKQDNTSGINRVYLLLIGDNFYLMPDSHYFKYANNLISDSGFSLRPESKKDFYIAYKIDKNTNVKNNIYLQLTQLPNKKLIKIK